MTLYLLFADEVRGFYKSKVMLFLWIGMPLLVIVFSLWSPQTNGDLPFTVISSLIVSSIGGSLASILLTVSLIHEKERNVFELFIIRPLKRSDLLIAKFFAVYLLIMLANGIALSFGLLADLVVSGTVPKAALASTVDSLALSFSYLAIQCSAGVFVGIVSPSILVGVIIVMFGVNNIAAVSIVPFMAEFSGKVPVTLAIGAAFAVVFLLLAVKVFNKQQY